MLLAECIDTLGPSTDGLLHAYNQTHFAIGRLLNVHFQSSSLTFYFAVARIPNSHPAYIHLVGAQLNGINVRGHLCADYYCARVTFGWTCCITTQIVHSGVSKTAALNAHTMCNWNQKRWLPALYMFASTARQCVWCGGYLFKWNS